MEVEEQRGRRRAAAVVGRRRSPAALSMGSHAGGVGGVDPRAAKGADGLGGADPGLTGPAARGGGGGHVAGGGRLRAAARTRPVQSGRVRRRRGARLGYDLREKSGRGTYL